MLAGRPDSIPVSGTRLGRGHVTGAFRPETGKEGSVHEKAHAATFSTGRHRSPNSLGARYGERAPELRRLRARHVAVLEVEARATMAAQETALPFPSVVSPGCRR